MDGKRAKQVAKQLVRRSIGEPHVGKRIKMRRLESALPELGLSPTAILDAGAEDATFVYWLADRYPKATVTAVDIDGAAISACLASRPSRYADRVFFECCAFADLDPESYDLITAFDVLEHIPDDRGAVEDLVRTLRPGGQLLTHTPRDTWTQRDGTVHDVPDDEAWKINPGHVRQGYSPQGMRQLLEDGGLEVRRVETWIGRWGTFAHEFYDRLEHPAPVRLITLPVTDVCARLDKRQGETGRGNSVFVQSVKPGSTGRSL